MTTTKLAALVGVPAIAITSCSPPTTSSVPAVDTETAPTAIADITGPIPVTAESGEPFRGASEQPVAGPGLPLPVLVSYGYVEEEYFVSGTVGGKPYSTALLVRKPQDTARFSGLVAVETIHAAGAIPLWGSRDVWLAGNHGWVAVASQRTALESHVKQFNPERYATLEVPEAAAPAGAPAADAREAQDLVSQEIMTQVGALGTALAAGAPLPVRFGTWFWGLGITPGRFHPRQAGSDWEVLPETEPFAAYKNKVSIFGGFDCLTDGRPNFPHGTGGPCIRTGVAPSVGGGLPAQSFDSIIAEHIGSNTRFRSLDVSAIGDRRNSLSGQGAGQMNPVETNAVRFYQRIFGEGFVDPNAATFTPDPTTIARRSVLSVVSDQRKALEKRLGAADRARLDQYFTGVRQVESQLALQLEKPEPLVACKVPDAASEEKEVANVLEDVSENHETMARLLAMALACNQTKVFNVSFNNGASSLTRRGSATSHHQLTHDEAIDAALGYQPESTLFIADIMKAWGDFLGILDGTQEGDGTLLDRMLVVAHSETELAKNHNITNMPVMFAGQAGGRVRSGLSVIEQAEPVSRIGLTAMQVMGVPIDSFGGGSMETRKPITEVVV